MENLLKALKSLERLTTESQIELVIQLIKDKEGETILVEEFINCLVKINKNVKDTYKLIENGDTPILLFFDLPTMAYMRKMLDALKLDESDEKIIMDIYFRIRSIDKYIYDFLRWEKYCRERKS